jgi:predicted nucleic acid-binding Zn ribbon protein
MNRFPLDTGLGLLDVTALVERGLLAPVTPAPLTMNDLERLALEYERTNERTAPPSIETGAVSLGGGTDDLIPGMAGQGRGYVRNCPYCGNEVTGHETRQFCSVSCRVQTSKRKRKLATALVCQAFDVPADKAQLVIEHAGMTRVTALLNREGYRWNASTLEWAKGAA